MEVALQLVWSIELHACGAAASKPKAGEQAGQPEDMVTVHVGDEHPAQLRQAQITAKELMLRSFSAVEQPHLRALWQAQGHCGDVAGPGGHPRTRTEKSDLQGR